MSLHHMLRAAAGYQATAPATTDPQFNYVSMLLHGDGTNGAQNNTFLDSSSNNFTITRNGNTTQGSLSPYGNLWSNYFDGTGDYLSTPSNAAFGIDSGDFTVECWVYLNSYTSGATTDIMYGSNNLQNFHIGGTTNSPGKLGYYNGGGLSSSAGDVPLNAWTHIACTRSGTTIRLFRNGAVVATGTVATTSPGAISLTIGGNTTGAYLNGYMSNMRIVKGTALYTSAFTPSTTPLTAVSGTSLLTCQSNRFIDNSANNFTITRNGDVRVTKESPFLPTAAYSTSTIGGSGYFDGNGDYLDLPLNTALNPGAGDFCFEVWVYFNALNTGNIFDGQQNNIGIALDSANKISVGQSYVAYLLVDTDVAITGQWYHIVTCRAGTTLSLFVNGVRKASTTSSANFTTSTLNRIGWNSGSAYFNGYLSNMRLVKGSSVYNPASTTLTVPTAPLTAITNTSLLLNFTNAGIFDNAAENDLETVGNAQISTSVKKYGTGSIAFDGTGDWLLVPDEANLRMGTGNFTVEAWVYLSATGSARGLVGKGTSTTGWLLSTNSSDQVVFTYGSTTLTSSSALSANTWTHVAVVREGTGTNQTKIYIGGSLVATGTVATDFNQTNPMYIGADRTGGSALNGYIDDLRITKGFARYTAAFTPPTAAFPDQ